MSASQRYRIGYALGPKKEKTFILPSLADHAARHGVVLVPIDPALPLIDQAPFHCILHKLYDPNWIQNLHEFTSKNPTTVIVDPPDQIQSLRNRISMLDAVNRVRIPGEFDLGVPKQVTIRDSDGLKKKNLDLKFPAIAKPETADGAAGSHELFVVFNAGGLEKIMKEKKSPMVVQEFVKHGGAVFKVYVVGDHHVKCVKRRSLPDKLAEDEGDSDGGVLRISRISNSKEAVDVNEVEMPPREVVEEVARGLRKELELRLFNFDIIRDFCKNGKYVVIDINYFPGYEKLPDYESVFTDFLLDVVQNQYNPHQL